MRPENDEYRKTSKENGDRRTAREFLELLVAQECEIHVILDVGAQVLELTNREFAEAWLELKPDAKAAIYFDEDDELYVLTQEGNKQPLQESSFARRLDECVVYLDDAHTRGTDIKFPIGFRAAVTLGPKVTKDRLTQGMTTTSFSNITTDPGSRLHAHAEARTWSFRDVLRTT